MSQFAGPPFDSLQGKPPYTMTSLQSSKASCPEVLTSARPLEGQLPKTSTAQAGNRMPESQSVSVKFHNVRHARFAAAILLPWSCGLSPLGKALAASAGAASNGELNLWLKTITNRRQGFPSLPLSLRSHLCFQLASHCSLCQSLLL